MRCFTCFFRLRLDQTQPSSAQIRTNSRLSAQICSLDPQSRSAVPIHSPDQQSRSGVPINSPDEQFRSADPISNPDPESLSGAAGDFATSRLKLGPCVRFSALCSLRCPYVRFAAPMFASLRPLPQVWLSWSSDDNVPLGPGGIGVQSIGITRLDKDTLAVSCEPGNLILPIVDVAQFEAPSSRMASYCTFMGVAGCPPFTASAWGRFVFEGPSLMRRKGWVYLFFSASYWTSPNYGAPPQPRAAVCCQSPLQRLHEWLQLTPLAFTCNSPPLDAPSDPSTLFRSPWPFHSCTHAARRTHRVPLRRRDLLGCAPQASTSWRLAPWLSSPTGCPGACPACTCSRTRTPTARATPLGTAGRCWRRTASRGCSGATDGASALPLLDPTT